MIGFDQSRLLAASALALGFLATPTFARAAESSTSATIGASDSARSDDRVLKTVTLIRDGLASAIMTSAPTARALLAETGTTVTREDRVSVPLDAPLIDGTQVEIVFARRYVVLDRGVRREVRSTGATVAEVLAALNVRPGAHDVVSPGLFTRPTPDALISVTSARPVVAGRTRATGLAGARHRALALRVVRGAPHAAAVARGVGEYAAFARLAHRGFASTVSMAGTAMHMVATAYTASCAGCSGRTASGRLAGHGIVAVDPRVIPLGTRLYIPGYGRAVAGDTGGAIKGRRMDLGFNRLRDALLFGRREILVFVLRRDPVR